MRPARAAPWYRVEQRCCLRDRSPFGRRVRAVCTSWLQRSAWRPTWPATAVYWAKGGQEAPRPCQASQGVECGGGMTTAKHGEVAMIECPKDSRVGGRDVVVVAVGEGGSVCSFGADDAREDPPTVRQSSGKAIGACHRTRWEPSFEQPPKVHRSSGRAPEACHTTRWGPQIEVRRVGKTAQLARKERSWARKIVQETQHCAPPQEIRNHDRHRRPSVLSTS
mmetsp:Transcript_19103/g.41538  ORF Transcript_19103/g.41538 Transcript_19103/m.41538 type:complete len:222 (-) Transcript_19103:2-667(-)